MTDQHLRDEQIQAFLDGTSVEAMAVAAHIEACPRCRIAVEEYRHLFSGLTTMAEPKLAVDFADRVMGRLPDHPPKGILAHFKRALAGEGMPVFAAFGAIAAAAIIFIKPSLWTGLFQGLFSSSVPANQHALKTAEGMLGTLKISPDLLTAVALTIAAIGLIDWVITRRRRAHHPMIHLV